MKWSSGGRFRSLLVLVLLCAGLLLWCPLESVQAQSLQPPTPSISTLKDNLTQALALTQSLQQSLQLRVASYQALKDSYDKLVELNQQLQASLSDSEKQLQTAQADLQATKALSESLQASLEKASKSLQDYKAETDKAVRDVELQRDAWKYVGIGALVVVVGETVYLLVRR